MLVDFWAILVFAIICVLIFIVIMLAKSDNTQKIQEEFANKDVNLILNSFLRAPYNTWGGQSIAEIIAEDKITGDYTRTMGALESYLNGVNIYQDNPVGGYTLGIDDNLIYFYNLKNVAFIEQAGKSMLTNSLWTGGFVPMPIGQMGKIVEGQNIDSIHYSMAHTTIPSKDGQDIRVTIAIIYDKKNDKKFS